ncbi:NYN domain-containing protein [bacterium]|nr:NYN domain-containing protein [bacterium]
MKEIHNIAFIDAQNLTQNMKNARKAWKTDLVKFRVFLQEKFNCNLAYYFIGVKMEKHQKLYKFLYHIGYQVIFREHDPKSKGAKKTNVDTDIVFSMMEHAYRKKDCQQLVLVSNDGDYKKTVSCLIEDKKFRAIMFPSEHSSSLYRKIDNKYIIKLYHQDNKNILELKK